MSAPVRLGSKIGSVRRHARTARGGLPGDAGGAHGLHPQARRVHERQSVDRHRARGEQELEAQQRRGGRRLLRRLIHVHGSYFFVFGIFSFPLEIFGYGGRV